jgi:two-component system LytT family sensor kinase
MKRSVGRKSVRPIEPGPQGRCPSFAGRRRLQFSFILPTGNVVDARGAGLLGEMVAGNAAFGYTSLKVSIPYPRVRRVANEARGDATLLTSLHRFVSQRFTSSRGLASVSEEPDFGLAMDTLTSVKDLLFTLLLKVGVASSFAALLARWNTFRRVLFTEERDPDQKLKLMLFMTPPLIVGVSLRLVGFPYRFADLSLEGAFLMGLLGGRVVGPIGGAIITIPALMAHEWLAMPAASTAGLLGGLMRQAIPNKEDLWNFGPFTFLNIPRDVVRLVRHAQMSWELLPLLACVGLELGRVALAIATKPKWLFAIDPHWNWWLLLCVLATVMSVAAPLKIWNNTRVEMNLEQHQQLLLKARMDALSSQINPHFLFNTLNTVSSLIRFDPDAARGVVLKLSNILRRLLRKHETFVPLREELQFIDDYLDIEVARFGRDNLEIVKKVDEEALEVFVPSMLLQPIVENCLKHGLAPKIDGGKIQLRTVNRDGRLRIEIEDNGVGISEEKMPHVYVEGIGLSNVRERLRVLYGTDFRLEIESPPGTGTLIRIDIPELVSSMQPVGT